MERDDIKEYSLDVHHSEEEGKKIRKKIWFVFWVLLIVTIVEVAMGAYLSGKEEYKTLLKVAFIFFTIVKAGYIVMTFMHLGDEVRPLKYAILIPYISFVLYLLFICFWEATSMFEVLKFWG